MNKLKKLAVTLTTLGSIFAMCACGSTMEFSGEDFIAIEDVIAHAKTLTSGSGSQSSTGTKGTPNFNVPEEGYDGSEVEIKLLTTQGKGLKDITDKYIAKFNEIYPKITVVHETGGGYDDVRDTIKTQIAVKAEPDIAYCYPDHVALYNLAKATVSLDNLIDSKISVAGGGILGLTDAQKADFVPGYYQEGQQFGDGLMYTMPFSKSTECLYYNKDVFTAEGLTVPDHWFSESATDTTSVEYVCEKLKAKYPNDIPLGYDSEANWMITLAEQCGADYTSAKDPHFLFDNTTMKAISKRLAEWYGKGWVTTQNLYGAYTSGLFIADGSESAPTRSFMCIGSSAGASHQVPAKVDGKYPFEVGITTIPQMSSTNRRVISQGPSVCIFKKSNPQRVVASWLLVKYLTTSVEFQAEFGLSSGYVPVLKSVAQEPIYAAEIAKAGTGNDSTTALAAKVCIEQEDAYYTSPAFNGSSMARDQIGNVLMKILPGCSAKSNEDINKFINKTFYEAVQKCNQSIQ